MNESIDRCGDVSTSQVSFFLGTTMSMESKKVHVYCVYMRVYCLKMLDVVSLKVVVTM